MASSAKEALAAIQGGLEPDALIIDVGMPDMDGPTALTELKATEGLSQIPVIFMTALTETEHKVSGFEAGAVDYVTKPIQSAELLARLTTHLRIQR